MLPTELGLQMLFCLRFAGLGMMLGVLYDLLRAVRMRFRLKRWGTAVMDLLFCMLALLAFLLMMLQRTDGRLRGFLFLGLTLGFCLYRKAVSHSVLKGLLWSLRIMGQALDLLGETVVWLFSFPRGN